MERGRYDAYGGAAVLDADGTDDTDGVSDAENPYAFTARRLDLESDLMYYRNRQYSVVLGRFISRDPIGYGDSFNLYWYATCRPTVTADPAGKWVVGLGAQMSAMLFVWWNSRQVMALWDGFGNRGVLDCKYTGVGLGLSFGGSVCGLGTNADTICDLTGVSLVFGGSVTVVPPLVVGGVDVTVGPKASYFILEGNIGLGYGTPEGHIGAARCRLRWQNNRPCKRAQPVPPNRPAPGFAPAFRNAIRGLVAWARHRGVPPTNRQLPHRLYQVRFPWYDAEEMPTVDDATGCGL